MKSGSIAETQIFQPVGEACCTAAVANPGIAVHVAALTLCRYVGNRMLGTAATMCYKRDNFFPFRR